MPPKIGKKDKNGFPKRMTRGVFRGIWFDSQKEYDDALRNKRARELIIAGDNPQPFAPTDILEAETEEQVATIPLETKDAVVVACPHCSHILLRVVGL